MFYAVFNAVLGFGAAILPIFLINPECRFSAILHICCFCLRPFYYQSQWNESLAEDTLGTSSLLRWLNRSFMSPGCTIRSRLKSSWVEFLDAKGVWNVFGNFFSFEFNDVVCCNYERERKIFGIILINTYRIDAYNRSMWIKLVLSSNW